MSRSVSSVRSSDPWLRRTDKRPLAQRRGLPPSAGKIGQHFFRLLRPGLAAQLHRLFCIFAELLSFCHGALPPRAPPCEMSPPFEWLSGQNCSLCESSLVVAQGKMHLGEVFGSIRAALFVLRQFAADVGTLAPSNGWLGDASHCVIGEHPMLPWLALTFTAARLGFERRTQQCFAS